MGWFTSNKSKIQSKIDHLKERREKAREDLARYRAKREEILNELAEKWGVDYRFDDTARFTRKYDGYIDGEESFIAEMNDQIEDLVDTL